MGNPSPAISSTLHQVTFQDLRSGRNSTHRSHSSAPPREKVSQTTTTDLYCLFLFDGTSHLCCLSATALKPDSSPQVIPHGSQVHDAAKASVPKLFLVVQVRPSKKFKANLLASPSPFRLRRLSVPPFEPTASAALASLSFRSDRFPASRPISNPANSSLKG